MYVGVPQQVSNSFSNFQARAACWFHSMGPSYFKLFFWAGLYEVFPSVNLIFSVIFWSAHVFVARNGPLKNSLISWSGLYVGFPHGSLIFQCMRVSHSDPLIFSAIFWSVLYVG